MVRNIFYSVHLSLECWQNVKPVHNKTFPSLTLISLALYLLSQRSNFPSSFWNSLICSPPAQPFYTISQKIINLSFSLSFWGASRRLLLLSPSSRVRVSFPAFLSASLLSNLIHHLILYRKHCHTSVAICSNHFQFYFPTLFFSSFLLNKCIDITIWLDVKGILYYNVYMYTHTHTFCLELLSYYLLVDSHFYFWSALPRLANSWPVKPL